MNTRPLRRLMDTLSRRTPARNQAPPAAARPAAEAMEPRLLLSGTLLGVGLDADAPSLTFDNTGQIHYDAAGDELAVEANPLVFYIDGDAGPQRIFLQPSDFVIRAIVDADGELVSGADGPDLLISGSVDLDGDYIADLDGELLTGEITAFGALDTASGTDKYDFTFEVTGGPLAEQFEWRELGVTMTSENSTFAGSFAEDFSGGAKGKLGALELSAAMTIDIEKYVRGPAEQPCDCLCAVFGKPIVLSMVYTGDGPEATDHAQDPKKVSITGDPNDESPARIIVSSKSSPYDAKALIYFDSLVNLNETFVIDATAVGKDHLDVETFVFILDPDCNNLLQTVEFHTSCSQPLQLGDQFGSVRLLGFVGEDGEADLIEVPDDLGEDADEPTGPQIDVGDEATFTYVVTNTGEVDLENVQVVDDNETPADPADDFAPEAVEDAGFNVGDDDRDGVLDVGESWFYRAAKTVTEGQHVNIGSVTATPVDATGSVEDADPAHWFGVGETCDFEGLTPGYWKQCQHFHNWQGYDPSDSYEDVFGVSIPGCGSPTLLDALRAKGGGLGALMRHSVAALLNAAHPNVNYFYSVADVKAMVQTTFATGDYEATKDLFEAQNELGLDPDCHDDCWKPVKKTPKPKHHKAPKPKHHKAPKPKHHKAPKGHSQGHKAKGPHGKGPHKAGKKGGCGC